MNDKIKAILKDLPHAPGVYKMKNDNGEVIYIGKAKDLSKRVRQYFRKNYQHSTRTRKLVENIDDIEVITVDTELESMILETNLIKQFKPKYNILMKDDKNYVYIKITDEDFPRIQIVRKIKKDGSKYIGPKPAAHKVKATFKLLKKLFPFRHCNLDIEFIKENKDPNIDHEVKVSNKVIKYPCLDFHIKRCDAPCIGKITPKEYRAIIKKIEDFLAGKADNILKDLEEEMLHFAQTKQFERAAKTRDKLQKIRDILEKQKVATPDNKNQDIINYCITQNQAYFNLFQIREGKLLNQENFILNAKDAADNEEDSEILSAFLKQYYEICTDIPREIIVPHKIENKKELEIIVDQRLKVTVPQKGKKDKLLDISLNNARIYADRNKPKWYEVSESTIESTEKLAEILNLPNIPKRIECYDISHLSGTNTVGSMIVFENGAPKKSMYRKFKIRTVTGKPDDYKCMEEVLYRRLNKLVEKIQTEDYQVKKARKQDQKLIEEHQKNPSENFYIIEKTIKKKKKVVGIASLEERSKKVAEIKNLWIAPEERGQKLGHYLIRCLIKKAKAKRIYILCKPELKEYYQLLGFELIKKLPEELDCSLEECKKRLPECHAMATEKIKFKEDKSFSKIPDLLVIDGGKGQLRAAEKVLNKLDIQIPHISLAKRLEEIFVPGKKHSILLEKNNEALKLLQKARDEAHRFAISFNKQLRKKSTFN